MEKAICYIRVSTEEQSRFGVSLAAQEETLRAYCLLHKLEIVEVVREEGVSAAKPLGRRPGGEQLLKQIAQGTATHVVAYKLDRLFRDTVDCLQQSKAWDRGGVALHLVDMGGQALDTSSAMGRFFLNMMAAIAEMERQLISERTTAAIQHKKRQGQVYGATPFGFTRQGGRLVEDEGEQHLVSQVKEWRTEGLALRKIADRLNRQRVPTKKGGKWHGSTIKYLLDNDLYEEVI